MASDAIERIATILGLDIDLDEPEPALISQVERRVADLTAQRSMILTNKIA